MCLSFMNIHIWYKEDLYGPTTAVFAIKAEDVWRNSYIVPC